MSEMEQRLPTGWEFPRLQDACSITMGQSPASTDCNEEGNGLPFFQGKAEFGTLYPTVRKWRNTLTSHCLALCSLPS